MVERRAIQAARQCVSDNPCLRSREIRAGFARAVWCGVIMAVAVAVCVCGHARAQGKRGDEALSTSPLLRPPAHTLAPTPLT